MSSVNGLEYFLSPIFDVLSDLGTGVRAFSHLVPLSTPVNRVIEATRELRLLNFGMHSLYLSERTFYLVRKGKERTVTVLQMAGLSGNLLQDGAMLVIGLKSFGVVSAQVAATAGIVSFVGMGIQLISAGVHSYRIAQSVKEYINLTNIDAIVNDDKRTERFENLTSRKRRISFKALYGLKRKAIKAKVQSKELTRHLKKRLTWNIAFRAVIVVAALVGIAALAVLSFAPTPAAPVGWALLGTVAAVSIGCIGLKLFINYRHNKEFKALANKPVEKTE